MASSRGIGAATGAAHKPRKAAGATPDGRVSAEGFLDNAAPPASPEKARQNSKLLDSGITRVRAKSLDAHGFRLVDQLPR